MADASLQVRRANVDAPDAYDRHDALIWIDDELVGHLPLGQSLTVGITSGHHTVSVRLQYNFGTANIDVDAAPGATVTVTCEKAGAARNQVLHPSHYWRLTAT